MNNFFIVASILSFVGAVAFILVAIESGKFALLGMTIVMLCNGIILWKKSTGVGFDIKEQNVRGKEK